MSRRRVLAAAASGSVVSSIALAGCLGDDESGTDDENDEDDENGEGDEDTNDVVEIETREGEDDEPEFVFDPAIAEVEPGDTVRWVNTDGVFHTVTATDSLDGRTPSEEFNEEITSEGDSFEWTPEDEGVQHYYCEPHAGFMIGSLVVGDVSDEELEAVEDAHEEPTDEVEDDDDPGEDDGTDEEFVDMTGEDVVEIETRRGKEDEPDFVFDPAFVTVDTGTTIEWVNTDGVFHTVTSTDDVDQRSGGGDEFDATISSEGDSFEWDADDAGSQPYYCSPHAGFMYGALEIE